MVVPSKPTAIDQNDYYYYYYIFSYNLFFLFYLILNIGTWNIFRHGSDIITYSYLSKKCLIHEHYIPIFFYHLYSHAYYTDIYELDSSYCYFLAFCYLAWWILIGILLRCPLFNDIGLFYTQYPHILMLAYFYNI